jgi:hypothetical protein
VTDRKEMEGSCSTGQSSQWAVVPMEEEEEEGVIGHKIFRRLLPSRSPNNE